MNDRRTKHGLRVNLRPPVALISCLLLAEIAFAGAAISGKPEAKKPLPAIRIDVNQTQDGTATFTVGDRKLTEEELHKHLREDYRKNKDADGLSLRVVQVHTGPRVRWRHAATAMATCMRSFIWKVNLFCEGRGLLHQGPIEIAIVVPPQFAADKDLKRSKYISAYTLRIGDRYGLPSQLPEILHEQILLRGEKRVVISVEEGIVVEALELTVKRCREAGIHNITFGKTAARRQLDEKAQGPGTDTKVRKIKVALESKDRTSSAVAIKCDGKRVENMAALKRKLQSLAKSDNPPLFELAISPDVQLEQVSKAMDAYRESGLRDFKIVVPPPPTLMDHNKKN